MTGNPTLPVDTEVTSIQRTGFWMIIDNSEYFVDFEDYPDFAHATVSQIYNFRRSQAGLHWDGLDVDIEIAALSHPEGYPLRFKR